MMNDNRKIYDYLIIFGLKFLQSGLFWSEVFTMRTFGGHLDIRHSKLIHKFDCTPDMLPK